MPKPSVLTKAQLIEMGPHLTTAAPGVKPVPVQFNPESLKVSYSNQLVTDPNQGSQIGTAAMQHVGKGTTKLAVQLWFDVNHPTAEPDGGGPPVKDVRTLTGQVAYFITPNDKLDKGKFVIPGVRFQWGTFTFVGVMESLEETLELFSYEGTPLRASLSISLTQQEITAFAADQGMRLPKSADAPKPAGTVALTSATAGASVQSLAEGPTSAGGKNWQDIAAANGIENPRLLPPGQLIDVNAKVRTLI
jgi:hypothetical protein